MVLQEKLTSSTLKALNRLDSKDAGEGGRHLPSLWTLSQGWSALARHPLSEQQRLGAWPNCNDSGSCSGPPSESSASSGGPVTAASARAEQDRRSRSQHPEVAVVARHVTCVGRVP